MSCINPFDAMGGDRALRNLEFGKRMLDGAVRLYETLALRDLSDLPPHDIFAEFPREAEFANYTASVRQGGTPIAQRLDTPGAPRGEHV